MAKSRQARKSGGTKRSKKAYRPGAAAGPRAQQDADAGVLGAPASKAIAAKQTAPRGTATTVGPAQAASGPVDFGHEYHYVLGDLKRIAILAAAMFATLVVLALILT